MQNKLQELTDKLYIEGLSKGKEEGEQLLCKARKEAEETIGNAKAEAEAIVAAAHKEAADIKAKAESDIKTAAAQSLQSLKMDIENLLTYKITTDKTAAAMQDMEFIKGIIGTVAEKFSTSESTDLSLILPDKFRNELETWVDTELSKALKTEIKAEFSKKIQGGFTIGPKDGSWYISLSEDTFDKLISGYLRPVTRKLLFGE